MWHAASLQIPNGQRNHRPGKPCRDNSLFTVCFSLWFIDKYFVFLSTYYCIVMFLPVNLATNDTGRSGDKIKIFTIRKIDNKMYLF